MLIQLIYTSTPVTPVSEALSEFIPLAKIKNDSLGLSGVIISDSTSYTQVLEGEQSQINELFKSILADPRHKDVILLKYTEIERKMFDKWSMRHLRGDEKNLMKDDTNIELIKRILNLTDNKKPKPIKRLILSVLILISLLLTSIYGAIVEGKINEPFIGLTANVIAEHPTSVEVLIVGNRNRNRNCRLDNVVSQVDKENFNIQGNTKTISLNDFQEERLVLKISITPKGEKYNIQLRSRCHSLWMTPQTLTLTD